MGDAVRRISELYHLAHVAIWYACASKCVRVCVCVENVQQTIHCCIWNVYRHRIFVEYIYIYINIIRYILSFLSTIQ